MFGAVSREESFQRRFIESRVAKPIRLAASLDLARREQAIVESAAQSSLINVLDCSRAFARRAPSSDQTLFILGSGPSVEDLTEKDFALIKQGVSIGLNSWVIHPFVPDIYGFESVAEEGDSHEAGVLSSLLSRSDIIDASPLILHLRPHAWTKPNMQVHAPNELRKNFFFYGRTQLFTKSQKNLEGDIGVLLKAKNFGWFPQSILIDSGASVVRMASLGVFAGFKKIVFVGVDLSSTRYFFEVNPDRLKTVGVKSFNPWKDRGLMHQTQERDSRNFSAAEFIVSFAKMSNDFGGHQFFSGSRKSLLAEHLPIFDWGLKTPYLDS